jgi:hypothetical protein
MTTTTNASRDADVAPVLLMSEPPFPRGIDTPLRREASRTITYTWEIGEGDKWRNEDPSAANERVTFLAVLTITHNKKGRGAAHYSATLWQHQEASGMTSVVFDGRNGLGICTDTNRAGRYNANQLDAFARYALTELRSRITDERVLAYFKPERV